MPSDSVSLLSLDEVLAIHQRLIETFGGPPGVRDLGLVESALYRPGSGYYRDLAEMAAALFESLLMNHPFIDGNKRAGVLAAAVFLPLTQNPRIDPMLGTRHRAGVGVTEELDAIAIIVSEERGQVSVAEGGTLTRDLDESMLRKVLLNYLGPAKKPGDKKAQK